MSTGDSMFGSDGVQRLAAHAANLAYGVTDSILAGARVGTQRAGNSPPAGTPGGSTSGPWAPGTGSASLDRLFDAFAQVVREAGDTAREVARGGADAFSNVVPGRGTGDLSACGNPGDTVKLKLAVHNTGNVALKQVDFEATELIASVNDATRDPTFKHIERRQIKFTNGPMNRIRPRASGDTEMVIEIPQDATPAVYRGLVFANPGDACILLALTVLEPAPPPRAPKASPEKTEAPDVKPVA